MQIVGQIAERVRARFRAGDATKVEIKELASCVRSLLALGESPRVISKEYIKL